MPLRRGSSATTPGVFSISLGVVFLLCAVAVFLAAWHTFRYAAWLTGTTLTVRGGTGRRTCDLANSARVTAQSTRSARPIMLVAAPSGRAGVVNLPLRTVGPGGQLLPTGDLTALADAASTNPRAAYAVYVLRQLATNPVIAML